MRRVVLTGASGFIGARCVEPLLAAGDEVHAVSRGSRDGTAEGHPRLHRHRVDLLDPVAARRLLEEVRPTHLLHLAWFAVPGEFWTSPLNVRWVEASLALVRAFGEVGGTRVVTAGTCAEYDWTAGLATYAESAPRMPRTPYGVAKSALGDLLETHGRLAGLSTAWGRIFHLYGPAEDPRRLVAGTVSTLVQGREALCTSGEQVRDFLHVDDVAGAFVALLHSQVEGAVNVASGAGIAVRDVVLAIAARLEAEGLVRLGARPQPEGEPASLVADVTRLRDEVGFAPRFGLQSGLKDAIKWWLTYHQAAAVRLAARDES